MSKKYSRDQMLALTSRIEKLSPAEYSVIFDMITKDLTQYTRNNENVYINMSNVSDKTLDEISKYLEGLAPQKLKQTVNIRYEKPKNHVHQLSNYEKSLLRNGRSKYDEFSYESL